MAGSFTRLNSGNWRARVDVDGARISGTFPNKRAAEKWVGEQLNKKHAIHRYSFLEATHRYEEEVSPKKPSHENEVKRFAHLRRVYPKLFAMKLDQIESQHIEKFIDDRMETVKGSTVNRELNLLSNVFQKAIKWKWATASPTTHADRPDDPEPRERRITEEEIAIIEVAMGYSETIEPTLISQRVAIAFLFAIETAMRCGEITKLKKTDIDIKGKTVRLRAETTKGRRARSVPLSPKAIKLIEQVPGADADEWLGITSTQVDANFRRCRKKTSIVNLNFHDTRHEAITRLSKKMDVLDLARMTGHTDINELLTYYNRSAADLAGDLA